MSCKVSFISLCNVPLVQYEPTLFCNRALRKHTNAQNVEENKTTWMNRCSSELDRSQRRLARSRNGAEVRDRRQERVRDDGWICFHRLRTFSHPPAESEFITHADSNDNTDGFVPVRQHQAVNLNKYTTSKQKHSLPSNTTPFHTA